MKYRYSVSLIMLLLAVLVTPSQCGQQSPFAVRTIIAQGAVHKVKTWPFESTNGFFIASHIKPAHRKKVATSVMFLSFEKNDIIVNGKSTHVDSIVITPVNGSFTYAGRQFHGMVLVSYTAGILSIVNFDGEHEIALASAIADSMQTLNVHARPKQTTEIILPQNQESASHVSDAQHMAYKVRVLLEEQDATNAKKWVLATPYGVRLVDPQDSTKTIVLHDDTVSLSQKGGALYVNNKKITTPQVYVVPLQGHITFQGKPYQGGFLFTRYQGKALLINNVDLEDYICGVLKSESWPGWPLEVNKVMAIVCRTYVISMVQRSKISKLPYHIKDTKIHQVYSGVCDSPVIKEAVMQTKGIFIAYQGKPILAMFDSCCGGIIPAKMKGFEFSKAPYLKRTYACTHCKESKVYNWQVQYSLSSLTNILQKTFPKIKMIKKIKITKKDEAGIVHEVAIYTPKRTYTISGKKFYAIMQPKVKSSMFSISRDGDNFTIRGRGLGHQIGLCQWGARGMVSKGFGYKDIIQFYYPKTALMRLENV